MRAANGLKRDRRLSGKKEKKTGEIQLETREIYSKASMTCSTNNKMSVLAGPRWKKSIDWKKRYENSWEFGEESPQEKYGGKEEIIEKS